VVPTDHLGLELRPASADDLPAIADLYLRVREAAVPAMPPQIHTVEEVHAYVGGWDLGSATPGSPRSAASRPRSWSSRTTG
jgi:hypothetical protein